MGSPTGSTGASCSSATQLTSTALTAVLAGLAWDGAATEWVVIGFSGALGIVSALSIPAQQSLIAALVDEEDVPQAVALNSMTFNLARAIGPASAAGVIATLGIPWAFAINSALVPAALRRAAARESAAEEQRAETQLARATASGCSANGPRSSWRCSS